MILICVIAYPYAKQTTHLAKLFQRNRSMWIVNGERGQFQSPRMKLCCGFFIHFGKRMKCVDINLADIFHDDTQKLVKCYFASQTPFIFSDKTSVSTKSKNWNTNTTTYKTHMMTSWHGNPLIPNVTLWSKFNGPPSPKASNVELWSFLCCWVQ